MPQKRFSPTAIGVFVLGAIVIAILAIAIFGRGNLFTQNQRYVIFFTGSVQGLSPGAPVNLRGARVGTVLEMSVEYKSESKNVQIPVIIELERDSIKGIPKWAGKEERQNNILENKIRAQLEFVSIVTGQKAVALDFRPDTPERLVGADPRYPEIPSIASPIEQLSSRLEQLPIEDIATTFQDTLVGIDRLINSQETTEGVTALFTTIKEAQGVMQIFRKQVPELLKDTKELITLINDKVSATDAEGMSKELKAALAELHQTMNSLNRTLGSESLFERNVNHMLGEMTTAAREVRELAAMLRQRPESLVRGKSGGR